MEPSANTSLRRSTGRARHCSGDMYANLPFSVPSCVRVRWYAHFAMPKSETLTAPSYDTSTFDGETSRWTISSGSPPGPVRSCA